MTPLSALTDILVASLPLLLASFGALISEYAGVMAVFIDGIINLASFLTLAFGVFTRNIFIGIALAALLSALFIALVAAFTEKTKANPFVTAIAVNLFSSGVTSLLSTVLFNTKGVVYSPEVTAVFTQDVARLARKGAVLPVLVLCAALTLALTHTRWGLRTRSTGKSPEVLTERGVTPAPYRVLSWVVAAVLASLAGSLYTMRLSSFVPNISSGKGWIALAAVFLGRTTPLGTAIAALAFTTAEYLANNIQTAAITPTVLLALPYALCLAAFALLPRQEK